MHNMNIYHKAHSPSIEARKFKHVTFARITNSTKACTKALNMLKFYEGIYK